jgi:protein Mpv17
MGYMEGRNSEHIKEKYKDMYFPALRANWQVWPLVQVCSSHHISTSIDSGPDLHDSW